MASIQGVYLALFGRPADPLGLAFFNTATNNGANLTAIGDLSASAEYQDRFAGQSSTQIITSIYRSLFNREPDLAGLTFFATALANKTLTINNIAIAIFDGARGSDVTIRDLKVSAANAFTAAIDTVAEINGYTGAGPAASGASFIASVTTTAPTADQVTAAVLAATSIPPAPINLNLTSGLDTISGSVANETINGSAFLSAGTFVPTLNNADSIDGGAGTDTLFVQNPLAAATVITPASVKNVEVLSVESQGAGGLTVSLVNGDSALKTVTSSNAASATTVSNIQGALTTLNVSNTASATTVTSATGLTGTTDALTINLANVTGGAISAGTTAAGSGYETFNIVSGGTIANAPASFTDGAGTSLATVNVSGTQNLTLALLDTTVVTVDASTFAGKLGLTVAAGNTQAMTVKGGTANDTIGMNGTYTSADTIDGGAGTDTLTLTNAEAIAATTAQTKVTNVETIGLSDGLNGTVTVSNFAANGLTFGADMAGAGNVNYATGTASLNFSTFGSGGNALATTAAGTATNDVLNVTIGSATTGNTFGAGGVTINGSETVNLLSQGGANSFGAGFTITDTAATQSLVITGSQNITFTGAVRADVVNASGMTGTGALSIAAGTGTTATTITGTANADTLAGSTAGDIIDGGAGADTIANVVTGTNATASDVITGGAGFDTITLRGDAASGALATVLNNAAFVTDFTVGATATTTDILALSATAGNYSNVSAFFGGVAAAAAGSTVIQTVAQNAAAAAVITGTDLVKLTTNVVTTGLTLQQAFNTAIGTGTVTGLTAGDDLFFSFYDTTNARAIIGVVNSTAGTNTAIETGDTVTIVGSLSMTAADYNTFGSANLAIVAA